MVVSASWWASAARQLRLVVAALVVLVAVDGTAADLHAQTTVAAPAADSFPHARHAKVACLSCHGTGDQHGRVTIERPRGCQSCHHQNPAPDKCATCHRADRYGAAKPMTVTVSVPGRAPAPRTVMFVHARHASRPCTECHSTPVTMAPAPTKAACNDCHTEHHAVGRECTACHQLANPSAAHTPAALTHQGCDACHTPRIIAALTPTRQLCGACHVDKTRNHYLAGECTQCHFQASPAQYKAKLTKPPV